MAPNFKPVSAFILAGYFEENGAVSVNWFGIDVGSAVTVDIEVASREGEPIDRALSAVNEGVQGSLLAAFRR